jgi:hypothetical protein
MIETRSAREVSQKQLQLGGLQARLESSSEECSSQAVMESDEILVATVYGTTAEDTKGSQQRLELKKAH